MLVSGENIKSLKNKTTRNLKIILNPYLMLSTKLDLTQILNVEQ